MQINDFYRNHEKSRKYADAIRQSLIDGNGIHPVTDPEPCGKLRELTRKVLSVVGDEVLHDQKLGLIYCYDRDSMPTEKDRSAGGIVYDHQNLKTKEVMCSLGISTLVLAMPLNGQISVFLHELAHITSGADDGEEAFNQENARLCDLYSQRSGRQIEAVYTVKP